MAMRLQLLLAAAERDGDIGAVTEKIELALLPRGKVGADAQFAPSRISYQRRVRQKGCAFRKSYPNVMVVQSRQDWDGYNDPGPLHCPT
jgi:hypothetical protein